MPKTPPPVLGFNNNVRHQGRIFHIQTEDSGVKRPHVKTHLFGDGGRILKSARTDYSEHVGRADIAQVVRQMMKDQHKAMFVALRKGELNQIIEDAFGPPPAPKSGAAEPSVDSAPTSLPLSGPAPSLPEAKPEAAELDSKTEAAPPPARSEPPLQIPPTAPPISVPDLEPPLAPGPAIQPPRSAPPARPVSWPAPSDGPGRTPSVIPAAPSEPRIAAIEASQVPLSAEPPMDRVPVGSATRRPFAEPVPARLRRPSPSPPVTGTPAFGTPKVALPLSGAAGSGSRPPPASARPPSGPPPTGSRPPGSRPPSDPHAGRYSVVPPPEEAERYAVSRPASIFGEAKPARSIFGDDEMVGEKSLDEVILSYLAEDLEQPPRK